MWKYFRNQSHWKSGRSLLGNIPTSPAFDLISLSNDWWTLLTDSLRLGTLEALHASRPIMANNDSVKGGTYRKTGGLVQKQQCVSAGVNNKILKHTLIISQNFYSLIFPSSSQRKDQNVKKNITDGEWNPHRHSFSSMWFVARRAWHWMMALRKIDE